MSIRALAVGLLLVAAPAFAADLDGKWTGKIDTPNGPVDLAYQLKADGKTLTGTTTGPDGSPIPLKDGKIDGNKIAFTLTFSFGADPVTFNYTGVLAGNELKLHSEFMGMPIDFTLTKAK
jgi:hypothetical protein